MKLWIAPFLFMALALGACDEDTQADPGAIAGSQEAAAPTPEPSGALIMGLALLIAAGARR